MLIRSMKTSCAAMLAGALVGCSGQSPSPAEPADPAPTNPVEQAVLAGPLAQRLNDEFATRYAQVEGMSFSSLQAQHSQTYLPAPTFDVGAAPHYDGFVSTFGLSTDAQQKLKTGGFVVIPSPARGRTQMSMSEAEGAGPADVLYRVFAADLPVFISGDAILHAWHRSFDALMEGTETYELVPVLADLLQATMGSLDPSDPAQRDALFYLAVAQSLLDPTWTPPASVQADVSAMLEQIAQKQRAEVPFMGELTWIDFSQFIPRGHYTHSPTLEQYFRSLMWLGRTDLVLYDPDPTAVPRPREEAAARALASALHVGQAEPLFAKLDTYYRAVVGRTNALTPTTLLGLCDDAGLPACVGDPAAMQSTYAAQPPPEYSSRVFAGAVPPRAMRFFPQRFAYDAWVTSRTTVPRLPPLVQGGRAMAMPEDVAFALGSDRALDWFSDDLAKPYRENLPATLEASRQVMEAIPPTTLDDTIYNNWLEGLAALSKPTVDDRYPQVMRTAQWHDRKMEAVLASWAEMRHDTILIVEQSTGGAGCQYPKGYVEPVPELYASLSVAATRMSDLYATSTVFQNVPQFMANWKSVLATLSSLASKELAGEAMSDDDLAFLNTTVDEHGTSYYGDRQYNGWYPRLFWTRGWGADPSVMDSFESPPSGVAEPVVADVHTDAENNLALEVGVGNPGLMIVAIDNNGDTAIYGGPVSSYFSMEVPLDQRLNDNQWLERVDGNQLPPRPAFASSYWSE